MSQSKIMIGDNYLDRNIGDTPVSLPEKNNNKDTSFSNKTILTDTLDGYAFEKLCADIFQKLNYGNVELMPLSGDKGRDLIIHSPSGLIIVECKHMPRSSVGRPVVQKLHSAVISSGAVQGILITTGFFSLNAIDHAKELSPKIELMDKRDLVALAEKAGINLLLDGQENNLLMTHLSGNQEIEQRLLTFCENHFDSLPAKIPQLVKVSDREVTFLPAYIIHYDISAVFETGVGVIHSESMKNGYLLIDGVSGQLMDQNIANHLKSAGLSPYDETGFDISQFHRNNFFIDEKAITAAAKAIIVIQHTKNISYYGKNHRRYQKECVPPQKDVFITDIKKIYIPTQLLKIKILQQEYPLKGIENSQNILSTTNILSCRICGRHINKKGLICNSCGAVVHNQRLLDSHGFICRQCGKTICRKCTCSIGFNNHVCKECTEKRGTSFKPLPEFNHQISLVVISISALGFTISGITKNIIIGIIVLVLGIVVLILARYPSNPQYEII